MMARPGRHAESNGRYPRLFARPFCAPEGEAPAAENLLSPAEQAHLLQLATLVEYPRGGIRIFSEGEDAQALYLLDTGVVRLSRHFRSGDRQVLSFMWPGDLIGLAEEGRYVNSAETLSATTAFRLPLERLRRLLHGEPDLQLHLLAKATHELRQAQRQIIVLGQMGTVQRVVSFLLDTCRHASVYDRASGRLRLPMSRFDIADYLGTSAESVTRAFAALEAAGLIRRTTPRSLELPDPARLARFLTGAGAE